jgi:hypothetical protein
MKLFTESQKAKLLENGKKNAAHIARDGNTEDVAPVARAVARLRSNHSAREQAGWNYHGEPRRAAYASDLGE